jgi:hypothetical protein
MPLQKQGHFAFLSGVATFRCISVPAIIGLESAVNPLVSDNSPSWSSNVNGFMV